MMKKVVLMCLVAVGLAARVAAEDVGVLLEKAVQLDETAGDAVAAEKGYRDAIAADTRNDALVAETLYRLGGLLLKQKRPAEARDIFLELKEKHPDQKAWFGKAAALMPELNAEQQSRALSTAWALWAGRRLPDAEKAFRDITVAQPKTVDAWNGLGWALLNLGKADEAQAAFEQCIKLSENHPAALNGLGWIAKGKGEIDAAVGYWEKAVRTNPGATAAISGLAQVATERQSYGEAIKLYEEILKLEPQNSDTMRQLEIVRNRAKQAAENNPERELDLRWEKAKKKGKTIELLDLQEERVKARIERGDKYRDMPTLRDVLDALGDSSEQRAVLRAEVAKRLEQATPDSPMRWRYLEVLGHLDYDTAVRAYAGAEIVKEKRAEAVKLVEAAMKAYPDRQYEYPPRESYYGPLVALRGYMISGMEGAETGAAKTVALLETDPKFHWLDWSYWIDWEIKDEAKQLRFLTSVRDAYAKRTAAFPAEADLIKGYVANLNVEIEKRQ